MTRKLLNSDLANSKRRKNRSRSKSRTRLQGRQFDKIKSGAPNSIDVIGRSGGGSKFKREGSHGSKFTSGSSKISSSTGRATGAASRGKKGKSWSANVRLPRKETKETEVKKQGPIIDMRALSRGRLPRPSKVGDNNGSPEGAAETTFTKTTVGSSESDNERASSAIIPRPQRSNSRARSRGRDGGRSLSRGRIPKNKDMKKHNAEADLSAQRQQSMEKYREVYNETLDRSLESSNSSKSNNSIDNPPKDEGALIPYKSKTSSGTKGTKTSNQSVKEDDEAKRCMFHPSIVLQEKIYDRWLVLHSECPKCAQDSEREEKKNREKCHHPGKVGGAVGKRGFMKRLGDKGREIGRMGGGRSRSRQQQRGSAFQTHGFRSPSPNASDRSPSRSMSRSYRSGSRGSVSRSRSDSPNSFSRQSSQGSFDGSQRSLSPSRGSSFSNRPSYGRRSSMSMSPPRTLGTTHQRKLPSSQPRGRDLNASNDYSESIMNESETAIVLRERTPSPTGQSVELNSNAGQSVEMNPNRVPRRSPMRRNSFSRSTSPNFVRRGGRSLSRGRDGSSNSFDRPPSRCTSVRRQGPGPERQGSRRGCSRPPSPESLMHRPQSRGRMNQRRSSSFSRSSSPQNSISMGRASSRPRRPSVGRSISQRRHSSFSSYPQNSIGGPDSRGRPDNERRRPGRPMNQRRASTFSRSPSPQNSMMGRPQSRLRRPSLGQNSMGRASSRPRLSQRRELSAGRSLGNQRRSPVGRPRRVSSFSRSPSPPNRRPSVGRARPLSQHRGPSRPASPNLMERRPMSRPQSRGSWSRSPSPNSMPSRGRPPYRKNSFHNNSLGRRSARSLSSRSGSSWEFQSEESSSESSNADYFDDDKGEIVVHLRKKGSRRRSFCKNSSFNDSYVPVSNAHSPPRRRGSSFDESFDGAPPSGCHPSRSRNPLTHSRAPPPDRLPGGKRSSFNDSFTRASAPAPPRRRNSFEDSFTRPPTPSNPQRRPLSRKNSFDNDFDYRRRNSFGSQEDDDGSSLGRMAHRMSHGNESVGVTTNYSMGMGTEWSEHSQVRSKSKDLSMLLKQVKSPNQGAGGRSVTSSVSRTSYRGIPASSMSQQPRRHTDMVDRSLSPPRGLADRVMEIEDRVNNPRSSSVGRRQLDSSSRSGDLPRRSSLARKPVDMRKINKALEKIKDLPHVRSDSSVPLHAPTDARLPGPRGIPKEAAQERHNKSPGRSDKSAKDRQNNYFLSPQDHATSSRSPSPDQRQGDMLPPHMQPEFPPPPPPRTVPSSESLQRYHQTQPPTESADWKKYQLNQSHPHPQQNTENNEDWKQYQQNQPQMNDQPSAENEDWRKYQVVAGEGTKAARGKKERKSAPKAKQQHPTGRSPSVGRERAERGPNVNQDQGTEEWMKYKVGNSKSAKSETSGSRSVSSGRKGQIMFGSAPAKHTVGVSKRHAGKTVKQMPFTDQFGDFGLYTGQVDDDGQPHGKGSMKYDNGVFYEGTWTNGCQDQKAASQYGRIRGGFTSWQGQGKNATKSGMVLPWNARKNDAVDPNAKTNVRGMEWIDLNGDSGRYTGEVNSDKQPHGFGVMKYDFGLIAEGDWNNGVLKEGPQDRMISAAQSMMSGARSVGGNMSAGPGGMSICAGMSVGPGARGFSAASVGPMGSGGISVMGGAQSVGPGSTFGSGFVGGGGGMPMMYPQPMQIGGMNPMMMGRMPNSAQQHMMIAQQNAAMKAMGGMVPLGGSVYGGPMMPAPMQPPMMQGQMPMMMQGQGQMGPPPEQNPDRPPISEINIP